MSGVVTELQSLRYTPAGVPVVEFRLAHESERAEAGSRRKVNAEIDAVAFEAQARLLAAGPMGRLLIAEGFLCAKNRRSRKPVLHVTSIEFIEVTTAGN
ncbi:MAG: primosomal replication protein N [Candidatus Parcubacteria bacterium]|nr:primosomal replication protein N [Burkholderiales bacterium]